MGKYSLWLRIAELLAVVIVLIFSIIKTYKKGFALYFKILLFANACYVLFLLFDIISVVCLPLLLPVNVGDIGVLGCGAFLFSANFGQMDGFVDEKEKSTDLSRWLALIAPVVLLAVYCGLVFTSNAMLQFKLFGIIPVLSGIIASYYNLKHILLPADSMGLLKIVRPTNFFSLAFLLFVTVFVASSIAGYYNVKEISGILSAVFICLISIYSVKEAKQWKTSI